MTQKQLIDKYIKDFGSITGYECVLDLDILKYSARLSEMVRKGYPLKSRWEKRKNRYGETKRYKRYYYDEQRLPKIFQSQDRS